MEERQASGRSRQTQESGIVRRVACNQIRTAALKAEAHEKVGREKPQYGARLPES